MLLRASRIRPLIGGDTSCDFLSAYLHFSLLAVLRVQISLEGMMQRAPCIRPLIGGEQIKKPRGAITKDF